MSELPPDLVPPPVPGYVVEAALDSAGRAWRAVERATGNPVVLRPVAAVGAAVRDATRTRAARVAGVRVPGVLPLRTVVTTPEGLVAVTDPPVGRPLVELLAERGRLPPDEVAMLGAALADALAALHREGVAHGGVEAGAVHVGAAGPVLDPPALVASARPADDVAALAALCHSALLGRRGEPPDRPDALAVAAALADPATLADPARLGAALRTAARADPAVPAPARRLAAGSLRAQVPAPSADWRRRLLAALGAAVALLLAVAVGVVWAGRSTTPTSPALAGVSPSGSGAPGRTGGSPSPPARAPTGAPASASATPTPRVAPAPRRSARASPARSGAPGAPRVETSGSPRPFSWAAVLAALDRRRVAAFARGDLSLLRTVDAAGSPALRRDAAALAELVRQRARVERLAFTVVDVTVLDAGPPEVTLRVTDRRSGYRLVDRDGVAVRRGPRGAATWRVRLTWAGGWRVVDTVSA